MVQPRYPSVAVRMWRAQPWIGNPLMRVADRVEGVIRLLALLAALLAVPMAGAAGTAGYSSAVERIAAENAAKTSVAATISGDPVERSGTGRYARQTSSWFEATVHWNHNGQSGQETITVPRDSRRGDTVPVWLAADGSRTTPPLPPGAATTRGVNTGLGVLVSSWLGVAAVIVSAHRVFGLRHSLAWAREWRAISKPIGQDK
ncbi:Rv1733c family protein [Nocardia mexicana]|uniref:Uncharacterized protein n=1 Tax=Nocardia mexicana TaxID=279262 RepID=A0A370GJB3_9NOCA|nr:hypothetical protein [Nocardia mexicana]RDI43326.1 hypothetical protein DFR68_12289 [Nocardia mexicana]